MDSSSVPALDLNLCLLLTSCDKISLAWIIPITACNCSADVTTRWVMMEWKGDWASIWQKTKLGALHCLLWITEPKPLWRSGRQEEACWPLTLLPVPDRQFQFQMNVFPFPKSKLRRRVQRASGRWLQRPSRFWKATAFKRSGLETAFKTLMESLGGLTGVWLE